MPWTRQCKMECAVDKTPNNKVADARPFDDKRLKLLILIVAYNHETKIENVLKRIPESLSAHDTEILILDDSSSDKTFEKSHQLAASQNEAFKYTVLFNPINQGYGGNQKIGYHYAIENNFDVVALLHGDGQYAPECLPELLQPILAGNADAVFGSRMIESRSALKGGMPLYKYVGNTILSNYQNLVLGSSLSEFHSGYRLYSVRALASVPFELITNDFHFDTEIIIQFLRARFRIIEIPIPTHYGDEICHVPGLRYAWKVFKSTTLASLQDYGILNELKFDIHTDDDTGSKYESKLGFDSSHSYAVDAVPSGSKVLDLGCAGNFIAHSLRKKGCTVTGIDIEKVAAPDVDAFFQVDLDREPLPVAPKSFDVILMLDVIEHLSKPEKFVSELHEQLSASPDTEIIVTTGNVAFFIVRLMLLLGFFNYGRRGILERTHTRLFTFKSFMKLFSERGFDVVSSKGVPPPYPLAFGDNAYSRTLLRLNKILIHLSKGLFSYQIYLRLKPRPSLPWLLERANDRKLNSPR